MKEYVGGNTEFYTAGSCCDAVGHTIIALFSFH